MPLSSLLLRLDGRIPRKQFWLASLALFIAFALIGFLLIGLGFSQATTITGTVQAPGQPERTFTSTEWKLAPLASFLLTLLMAWPLTAIGVKRRRDRDSSGVDVIAFMALWLLLGLLEILNVGGFLIEAASLVILVWGIYLLVVLGFLKGTTGPNQYGPDPLGDTAAATA